MRPQKVMIRLSAQEKTTLESRASLEGLKVASWARQELLRSARAAQKQADEPSPEEAQRPGLLSLFCGPGGLDQGFRDAGFRTLLAIDKDKDCVKTFQYNHKTSKAFVRDLTKLTVAELDKLYGMRLEPVGVIGGPPCQSFSVSNVHPKHRDPRHGLPEAYAKLLGKLNKRRPISFFVFENVPGLLGKKHVHRYEKFKDLFERAGFVISEATLDAQFYGVGQERSRIFIVGINQKLHPGKVWTPPARTPERKTVHNLIHGLPEPVFNSRGLDPETFLVHPNHWCLVPKSSKFAARIKEGEAWGRSFRALRWDKPSWTVAYGHREVHVHPNGRRRLSIYEALLLQSFPQHYRLIGNMTAQVRLVSEAVPPELGKHVAASIRDTIGL